MSEEVATTETAEVAETTEAVTQEPVQESEEQSSEQSVEATTEEELQEEIDEAIEDGATEEEVKDMIKEFELKVNGKTKKVKVDLSDEKELVRRLQLAEVAPKAMQDLAEFKKSVSSELLAAKEDPRQLLQQLGIDPKTFAEEIINQEIEQMKKSPEQIEREKMQRELEVARAELARQKQEAEEAKTLQMQQDASMKLEQEIMSALQKNPTLPKTMKTVGRITDAMLWAMENGYGDVTVTDVLPSVEAEIRREFNEFISEMPEEIMESYLGKKNIDRLRKKRLAAMKKVAPKPEVTKISNPDKKEIANRRESDKKISAKDFFRNL